MKKITSILIVLIIVLQANAQNRQIAIDSVNRFLKTYSSGSYGPFILNGNELTLKTRHEGRDFLLQLSDIDGVKIQKDNYCIIYCKENKKSIQQSWNNNFISELTLVNLRNDEQKANHLQFLLNILFNSPNTDIAKAKPCNYKDLDDRTIKCDCVNGKLTGKASIYNKDGSLFFEGIYKDNVIAGFGKMIYPTMTYEGNFENNTFNGYGTATFTDGNKYQGNFTDGKYKGKGKYYFTNGNVYEGDFENNLRTGKGTLNYSDGTKYIGDFKKDKFDGFGTMYYANKDKYIGDWIEGQWNGKGKYIKKDVGTFEAIFSKGSFTNATLTYADGKKITGKFYNWEPTGLVTIKHVNGKTETKDFSKTSKTNEDVVVSNNEDVVVSNNNSKSYKSNTNENSNEERNKKIIRQTNDDVKREFDKLQDMDKRLKQAINAYNSGNSLYQSDVRSLSYELMSISGRIWSIYNEALQKIVNNEKAISVIKSEMNATLKIRETYEKIYKESKSQ